MSTPAPTSSTYRVSRTQWWTAFAVVVGTGIVLRAARRLLANRRLAEHARERSLFPKQTRYGQIRINVDGTPAAYDEYKAAVRTAAEESPQKPWYAYVGAANDPSTGAPWCGDCRVANPIVHAAFERASAIRSSILVVAVFVDRASYKDAVNPHPLRTDAQLKLTAVPTLFKFEGTNCVARLVEGDCAKQELVEAFIRE